MKRLVDILGALCGLVLLSPVLLLTALAVLLNDGFPVFFRQTRLGLGGQEFGIIKFRSMVKNAAALGPHFTSAGDARITRVGRFIRRTSLDELPQLLNVVLGNMSLVGPRPEVLAQRADYADADWALRCSVRPGITGLAQAKYRSMCTEQQRLACDLDYVRQQSLWLDLKILWWTVLRLSGKGSN